MSCYRYAQWPPGLLKDKWLVNAVILKLISIFPFSSSARHQIRLTTLWRQIFCFLQLVFSFNVMLCLRQMSILLPRLFQCLHCRAHWLIIQRRSHDRQKKFLPSFVDTSIDERKEKQNHDLEKSRTLYKLLLYCTFPSGCSHHLFWPSVLLSDAFTAGFLPWRNATVIGGSPLDPQGWCMCIGHERNWMRFCLFTHRGNAKVDEWCYGPDMT